jgi:hypothetical protein
MNRKWSLTTGLNYRKTIGGPIFGSVIIERGRGRAMIDGRNAGIAVPETR